MKKILAITGIRSDYDLLSPLYQLLNDCDQIELKLLVSGAHLSHSYGNTVDYIKKDNFDILLQIETLIDSDSNQSRIKSASILLQNSIDVIAQYKPDLIIYAGDREDVIVGSLIGGYLEIPTIHFYGGDHVKDSHIDNPVRHATSKLSTIHMVTLEDHKKRLVAMGELPERIFVVGNIALDRFSNFIPYSIDEINDILKPDVNFNEFALMIFHPVVEEKENAHEYFENILVSLKRKNIKTFISYPNIDPGSKKILEIIEKYSNDTNFYFYKNLERNLFISIYKHSDFIIGNSSSGIIESASIPVPAINVGIRQTGRYAEKNVIFTQTDIESIEKEIESVKSTTFLQKIKDIKNPYGSGNSAKKAFDIILNNDFKPFLYKVEDALDIKKG